MSNDRIVVESRTSWFSRVKSAFGGIVVGLVLIPVSLGLLFWNEGRAVTTARALAEGAGLVVDVDAGKIDAANEGRLVHVSGPVTATATPSDPDLGISAPGLSLDRKVEMFQWKEESRSETQKELGGSEKTVTTYTYSKVWSDDTIDSSSFKEPSGHQNPPKALSSASFPAASGKIGAFILSGEQLSSFGTSAPLPIAASEANALAEKLGTDKPVRVTSGALFVGASPDSPTVGDLRISYEIVKPGDGSLIAAQHGDGFGPYHTEAGRDLFLTSNGLKSAADMFADAVTGNTILTWGLRFVGMLLLFIGFRLILGVLAVVADVIPLLGSIVGAGVSLAALLPTLVLGPVTIAIAWFAYRPLTALITLAIGGLLVAGVVYLGKARNKAAASPA